MRLNLASTRAARAAGTALITCVAGGGLAVLATPASGTPVTSRATTRPSHHLLTAAPAGHLAPADCAQGSGTSACDLYAMSATASLDGTNVPIWGFSTSSAAGSATAPGPVLVVRQHDAVTITLHNQLAEPVALALPGQVGVAAGGIAGDDRTGAAAGGTRTYTFTADRAGTFLYEAGHTDDGARQAAMGLAGALVVLPGDGTAYGTAATAYDDEGVLVLTEVDPRLNADPAHFDMRNFRPAYRLINGKPFPATDPVSTDQGHKVLLRYVNAGAESHPMGVLGTTQLEIAQDGHLAAYATRLTAESIDPGSTLDTLVTMPAGPESKFAVYDTSQHLDNNGQTTASPVQVAFGGMLTFLDTAAPAPSSDAVGPVASNLKAAPNPSDGLAPVTITADLSDVDTGNSPIDQAEFVVDDVTIGAGHGVPMTGSFGGPTVAGATGTIPVAPAGGSCDPDPQTLIVPLALACLDAGKHRIFVRAHDTAGQWGVVDAVVFNLPKTGPATTNGAVDTPVSGTADADLTATGDDSAAGGKITAAEYWIDDPSSTHVAMTLNRSATVVSEDATVPAAALAGLSEGTHHVFVRSKDDLGLWGPPLDVAIVVDKTGPTVDAVAIGPNPSNGLVGDPNNPGYAVISGQLSDRDGGGALQSKLVAAEAFIDNATKAPGTGLQLLAVDGAINTSQETVYGLVPLSQLKALSNGEHAVYLRGEDAAGNWGSLAAAKLIIDKTAPVLGALSVTPNPTNGAATVTATAPLTETGLIQSAEYYFGATDPGVGKATLTQPTTGQNGTSVQLTIPTTGLARGSQTVTIRVKDQAGNWSNKVSTTFTVVPPNRIFASNFEPGDPAWSAATNGVSDTSGAKLPTSWESASTRGMQATLPNFGTRAAYRTDNSPLGEKTYHARFAFNRNSLNVGTSTVTLFRATIAAGGQVFAVQYSTLGTTGQVRIVLNGNTGTATSAWVPLASGTNQLQLDWSSSTSGTLALVLNGTTVLTQSRANGNLAVDTVQLGLVTGFANTNSGTAFFDSFSSGRSSAA